ncbi:hypothetical protein CLIB1444_13S03620 [[Candida] jaroonii]|uniref:Uncharacterized protein n=1 Tax=[Candida] jaroonii TaxID=467808 RepID=A0ACA9YDV1_9ASCO|nr:hypothetical protein CLIB1444_13S03620 [[Candida] jaroonii]
MSVGLSLKRYQSFHFSPSSKDIYKPNFIFSSDIPEVINKLIDVNDQITDSQFDLTDHLNIEFTINVELNMLMNRNKDLKPSDLIKDNLIFLAKSDESVIPLNFLNHLILPEDRKINIHPKKIINNEIFIVTLTLKVLKLLINNSMIQTIEFLKDENFSILLLCDCSLIDNIEEYIKKIFVLETLKTKPCLIDSNSTVVENDLNHEIGEINEATETTIEVSENDMNVNYDDLNDTSIDFMFLKNEKTIEDDTETLVGKQSIKFPNLFKYNPFSTEQDNSENFIKNVNNLRHNFHEIDEIDEGEEQFEINSDNEENEEHEIHIDDVPESPKNYKNANFPANIKLKPSKTEMKPIEESEDVLPRKSSKSFNLPSRNMIKSPSFTIDQNELDSFDYSGPSYIKGDKKFKYIKVGKVQKFVNLFEERVHEESESRSSSRPVSRSVSRSVSRATSPSRSYAF